MMELSRNWEKGFIKIEDISVNNHIPRKYLEYILLTLRKAGFLRSQRGFLGGYELAKAPDKISIAEIVRLMDGAIAPVSSVSKYFFAHSPIEQSKPLHNLFQEIRNMISDKMESTTFADLIK